MSRAITFPLLPEMRPPAIHHRSDARGHYPRPFLPAAAGEPVDWPGRCRAIGGARSRLERPHHEGGVPTARPHLSVSELRFPTEAARLDGARSSRDLRACESL